jgi:hypothetical protein
MKSLKPTIITFFMINLAIFAMAFAQTEAEERAKAAKQAVEVARESAEATKQEQKEIEAAMKMAKDNLEKAKVKLDEEKNKLEKKLALEMARFEGLDADSLGYGGGMGMGGFGGAMGAIGAYDTILVVPTEQIEPEKLSTITEDINVMARIFDKNIEPQRGNLRWQSWPFRRNDEATRAIYIQGYGVLFLTKVDFPLAPPPEIQVEKADSGTDPVWQRAKQEMFPSQIGIKSAGTTIVSNQHGTYSYLVSKHTSMATDYDPDRVDELKRKLLRLLRHATNIRNISDQEWITLAVTGASQPVIIKQVIVTSDKNESTPIIQKSSGEQASSVLTIRVKKADVDAFAQDKLGFDKFRERAEIITTRMNPQQARLLESESEEELVF